MSAAPLAVVLWRRPPNKGWAWLALALGVSGLADSLAHLGLDVWAVQHVYPLLQLGLLLPIFVTRYVALAVFSCVAGAALLSTYQGPLYAPEVVASTIAGGVVVWFLRQRADLGLVRPALMVYFGLGSLCMLPWPKLVAYPDAFLVAWLFYQGCRLVGLALVSVAVVRSRTLHLVR